MHILWRRCWLAFGLAGLVSTMAAAQAPADVAGRIKISTGTANIVRSGQLLPAAVGDAVLAADVLRTGADGSLAVTLKDETRVALRANSEVAISQFEYAPVEGQLALVVRIARGVMSYISGRIAKLAPSAVRLETPTSVIGVRGTHALISVEAP